MLRTQIENKAIDLMPEDQLAEEAIIGGIFLDKDAMYRIGSDLESKDFYSNAGQKIYEAILDVHAMGAHPDLITVTSRLKDKGQLREVGGEEYLKKLRDRVVTAENITAYSDMIHEKAKRRELISHSAAIATLAHDTAKPLEEVLDSVESGVFAITQKARRTKAAPLSSVMSILGDEMLERFNQESLPGFATGFYDLDALTQGLQRGDLSVWGARPSMGKTSLLIQAACNVAKAYQQPAIIFSLEMSKEQLGYRILSGEACIESGRLRTGRIAQMEWEPLGHAQTAISQWPVFIEDTPSISVGDIRSRSRQIAAEHGKPAIIIIDYLQIMGGADNERVQSLGKITRSLKGLARELDVHVALLSQLSRGVESRTNKRPMMSDLRESGSVEQDADVIVMLYREEYYDPDTPDRGLAELIAVKNRNGPTGNVKLLFQSEFTKFLNRVADRTTYQPPVPKKTMRPTFSSEEVEWDD